jgi:hypothetical protein
VTGNEKPPDANALVGSEPRTLDEKHSTEDLMWMAEAGFLHYLAETEIYPRSAESQGDRVFVNGLIGASKFHVVTRGDGPEVRKRARSVATRIHDHPEKFGSPPRDLKALVE